MNDRDSRYEDFERTDVLPQIALKSQPDERVDAAERPARSTLPAEQAAPFGIAAQSNNANGKVTALPAKPSTTDLAVGGIRGKIADLESRLLEAQDRQTTLKHHCEQLTQRCRITDERAVKAEAGYVQQASELHRVTQTAAEAQQRLQEERVRLQAQIVEIERQLAEARTRGDKRATSLEHLLSEQTERTAISERTAADARVELEKARGELGVTMASIRSLEERLAEQTQAAAEVTRLYSQQTSQVTKNAEVMANIEKTLAAAQVEKSACDERITKLAAELRAAGDTVAALQTDIATKLRHIAALEQGLANRDRTVDALQARLAAGENSSAVLLADKSALEQRCVELERVAVEARAVAANAGQETERLNTALRGNDVRINELSAALRAAEQSLRERDATIAESVEKAAASRREHALLTGHADDLRRRLDAAEQQIDALRVELQAKSVALQAAQTSADASQIGHDKVMEDMRILETEFGQMRTTMERVTQERNQLEIENHAGRDELSQLQNRYEEAAQTVIAIREAIALRDQKNAALQNDLRVATSRIEEANTQIERAAVAAEGFEAELRQRDDRIARLEQRCAEHVEALNAIGQDIERVSSANPSERLAAMGYALESLDHPGTVHRLGRATTTVGRVGTNDVAIDSSSVSRYHARIVVQPEGVWLIDLQSTNGCGVNGRRISRQILCDGDAVTIGHCKFRFSALGATQEKPVSDDAFPLLDEPVLMPAARIVNHDVKREQRH